MNACTPSESWLKYKLNMDLHDTIQRPVNKFGLNFNFSCRCTVTRKKSLHVLGFLASGKGPNLSFFMETKHMWRIRKIKNVQELEFWRTSGLDRGFDIITSHVIHFWTPWDHRNKMKPYLKLIVTIRMIRKE